MQKLRNFKRKYFTMFFFKYNSNNDKKDQTKDNKKSKIFTQL